MWIPSGLIAYKIWRSEQRLRIAQVSVSGGGRFALTSLLRILTETGIINAAYLLTYTVILVSGSQALEIMASIVRIILSPLQKCFWHSWIVCRLRHSLAYFSEPWSSVRLPQGTVTTLSYPALIDLTRCHYLLDLCIHQPLYMWMLNGPGMDLSMMVIKHSDLPPDTQKCRLVVVTKSMHSSRKRGLWDTLHYNLYLRMVIYI